MSYSDMDVSFSSDYTQSNNRKTTLINCLKDVTVLEEENHDNVKTIQKTKDILTQVDSLYCEVGTKHINLGESYLDSQVLCASSFVAIRCAEAASGNLNTYDKYELAEHISSNPDFWEFKLPYEAPPVIYLNGTFDATPAPREPRHKEPRKRVEKQAAAALKVPDNIARIETTGAAPEMVSKVYRFVRKACKTGPLSYFRVALDPTSFSKSVENIYYLSFLAKDGLLEVFIDDQTGLPHIKSRKKTEQDSNTINNQFIVSMDMKLWKDLIQALNIREPMMVIKEN